MDKRVYLAACDEYEEGKVSEAVHALLEHFGGASALAGGRRVVLKPNMLMARTPEEATTTHPEVVCALAREFIAAGCTVVIAESGGGPYNLGLLKKLYHTCGMDAAAQRSGAQLNFDLGSRAFPIPEGKRIKSMPVLNPVLDADFIVSVAKLKTHGMTQYTGAVKNLYGCVPGLTKAALHGRFPDINVFCEMIVDLCQALAPGLAVIDGIVGMQGKGPSGGVPKQAGVLIGAQNPHAADLAGVRVMGFAPDRVPTLREAIGRGLVPEKPEQLEYAGADPGAYEFRFLPPPRREPAKIVKYIPKRFRAPFDRWLVPYPFILKDKCIGCGACAQTCPKHTIEIREKRAQIDYTECIKCYCCHELCPVKAIGFKRNVKR